jgi:hypothetical protein
MQQLRALRAQRRTKQPTLAKDKTIQDTHMYMNTKVDPAMSRAITYMLIERPGPETMLQVLLEYFTQLAAGEPWRIIAKCARLCQPLDQPF